MQEALDDGPLHWSMIRLGMSSIADSFVAPLQDVLGLGSEARMNVPGRAEGNWSWRYSSEALTPDLKEHLKSITATFGRSPRFTKNNKPGAARG